MRKKSCRKLILTILVLLFVSAKSYAQFPYNIVDKRDHQYCEGCQSWVEAKPKEVLFGIHVMRDGYVYFSMDNIEWFNNIFKNDSYGVTVDLVSKERYTCNVTTAEAKLPRGTVLPPLYRRDLLNGNESSDGNIFVKIGKVPATLTQKMLEGNLVILNGNYVCYYTNFVNIARSAWQLLPMGLFTDSLINNTKMYGEDDGDFFTYTKKEQLVIPFEKGSASFSTNYLRHFFDSIKLGNYNIRKTEIRAYSSVEGLESVNKTLMKKRADTIVKALKLYEPLLKRIHIVTAENWLEYFEDIQNSDTKELISLSKAEARKKLADKVLVKQVEPILSKHRKAIVTVYLEGRSTAAFKNEEQILNAFRKAIAENNIQVARNIQKEIIDEISDNRLPVTYMDKLEVPQTKVFASLLNDREVYKYLLKATSEYEAYDNFLALQQLDPANGHINYNVCALGFFMWQFGGDTALQHTLLKQINKLPAYGINDILVKRMQINYHILKCEEDIRLFKYAAKDSSVDFIYNTYTGLILGDEDIYSLAKYFAYYSRLDYAEEIVIPRVDKLDISEDLLFFYINSQFYYPSNFDNDEFRKALINAVNINPIRFCDFFFPSDKGGASMQMLEYEILKKAYCETCH